MKRVTAIFLVGCSLSSLSQDYPRDEFDPARIADDLFALQEEDINYEELYEQYVQMYSNPIDLNRATAEELRQLNILSEIQVKNLLAHKLETGNLLSLYELQSVEGFDLPTIYKLLPVAIVSDPARELNRAYSNRLFSANNNYFVTRYERTLEKAAGHKQNLFQGTAERLYMRFRSARSGDYSMGFTAEKDAGEKIGWDPRARVYVADYLSVHFQLQNKRNLSNLIIGDYQFQFGQGLLLGNGFGLGKGGETITTIRKPNVGFLPYTSVNESGQFRGGAGTFRIGSAMQVSAFLSNTMRDAAIDDSAEPFFSSLLTNGLHRDESESRKRKNLKEVNYGTILQFKTGALEAGAIYLSTEYGLPMKKEPTPYNQFAFQGRVNRNASIFLNYTSGNISFFGEAAKTLKGGFGGVAGFLLSVSREFDMSVLYRHYAVNFRSFYSNALSENTTPQNEQGFYWGTKYRFNRRWSFAGYLDLFRFPWLKYRTYAPSTGNEFLLRGSYQPSRKIVLFVQYREESKNRNTGEITTVYRVDRGVKRNAAANVEFELIQGLKMRTRLQLSSYDFQGSVSRGTALVQDVVFSVWKLKFAARHAIFDTDNYDNRQYVYERDVWLAYSLPAYDGVGSRNYFIAEYKVSRHFGATFRYARSYFADRQEIGSGSQAIEGNTRNDVKLQLLFKF